MAANHKTMSVIHYIDPQCRSSKPASQALCLIECMMTFWTPWWPWFWLVSVQWLNGARCVGRRGNYKTPPPQVGDLASASECWIGRCTPPFMAAFLCPSFHWALYEYTFLLNLQQDSARRISCFGLREGTYQSQEVVFCILSPPDTLPL